MGKPGHPKASGAQDRYCRLLATFQHFSSGPAAIRLVGNGREPLKSLLSYLKPFDPGRSSQCGWWTSRPLAEVRVPYVLDEP